MISQKTPEQFTPGWLPPSGSALQLSQYLSEHSLEAQSILDYGCATGRNSRFLAQMGHAVVGVSLDIEEVKQAAKHDFSAYSSYVVADVRQPVFRRQFDAVLFNEVAHQMPKEDSKQVLRIVRSLTAPGGINAVSGYLITDDVESLKSRRQCFAELELLQSYENMGWQVLDYQEEKKPVQRFGEQELIGSIARILAKRPK